MVMNIPSLDTRSREVEEREAGYTGQVQCANTLRDNRIINFHSGKFSMVVTNFCTVLAAGCCAGEETL